MNTILKGNADLLPDLATLRTWCPWCDANIRADVAEANFNAVGAHVCNTCAIDVAHPAAATDVRHDMIEAARAAGGAA